MTATLAHRGPDGDGFWLDPDAGIALGHRRLAVVDLSPAGVQPAHSHDGRWVLTYNGELYNALELRDALDPHPWRGHCDAEVLVEAIARWGIAPALTRCNGMFALAAWDRHTRTLTLARDRLGEKPLFYGRVAGGFAFASELKAIAQAPGFARKLDPEAARQFLRFGYIPGPRSIWAGIAKLPPGHMLTVSADALDAQPQPWWRPPPPDPRPASFTDSVAAVGLLVDDAVQRRLAADVPVGVFLSGGLDSALVAAAMTRAGVHAQSFSMGFADPALDERDAAAAVAAALRITHRAFALTGADALAIVPRLPTQYDEPFADSSGIATHLLAARAREHVTVALTGDGGDELFGGYARYLSFDALWGRFGHLPRPIRAAAAAALRRLPAHAIARLVPGPLGRSLTPLRLAKIADALAAADVQAYFASLVTLWPLPAGDAPFDAIDIGAASDPLLAMMHADLTTYLPDDILVKVDRATMAVGLEGRMPLLDHRLVEAAARLPRDHKLHAGIGKLIPRALLAGRVPAAVLSLPKRGFAVPLDAWLRGPLKAVAEAWLRDRRGPVAAVVPWRDVDRAWGEHQAGRRDHGHRLWAVLMLLAWAREWSPA